MELERRRAEFVDFVAARLWVRADPIEDRIDSGQDTEQHLDQVARYCKEEAERLWKVLHP